MNGWVILSLLTALIFAVLLYVSKRRREIWSAVAAALVLAFAGYAIQGMPALKGQPAESRAKDYRAVEALLAIRADMDYPYSRSKQLLMMSDGFARKGKFDMAAAFLQSGLRKEPQNADLWAGLGLVLMLAGDGEMSAPARHAFARARASSKYHPAPDYFEGLHFLFKGEAGKTFALWKVLAERAPKNAKWKPRLESQLSGLAEMLLATAPDIQKTPQGTDKP
jgi:cytochrome c-type biogenesis protein CcmH